MPRDSAQPTNSLVVLLDTFSDAACDEAHACLAACSHLEHFTRLRSFARCLAVFATTADAQAARRALHSTCLGDSSNRLRLYYVQHAALAPQPLLDVPRQDKLWLISPPGSPPVDWRQTRESPPNAAHLDRRLEAALRELGHGRFALDLADVTDDDDDDSDVVPLDLGHRAGRFTIAAGGMDADNSDDGSDVGSSGGQHAAPAIIIQDCNHADSPWPEATPASTRPSPASTATAHRPTPRPPVTGSM
ncbi:hypothetical protein H4R19_006843 [Coemansia spiralis]|nr:hypothetical protein H4R19_006843 [Coemansia spiralis]